MAQPPRLTKHLPAVAAALMLLIVWVQTANCATNAARQYDAWEAMSQGRFADAITAIDDAIAANNNIGINFTIRSVALMSLERGPEAGDALHQAAALFQQDNDSRVWTYAWILMFRQVSLPPAQPGPPFLDTPYAERLLTAAAEYGSTQDPADKAKSLATIREIVAVFASDQFATFRPDLLRARVAQLDQAQRYALCIALVEKVRELSKGPIDGTIIGYSANSRLALGDFGGARAEYTEALRDDPANAAWFLGRCRCEIAMGSLPDAQSDIDCAKLADPDYTSKQGPELKTLISAAATAQGDQSTSNLAKELADAAASSKSDEELIGIAERLERARLAEQFIPEEQFTREYCRLFHIANEDPANTDKLLDVTGFLIRPTIQRTVVLNGATATAPVPCGSPNLDTAGHLLALALRAHPKNLRALEQSALLLSLRGRDDDMISVINEALAAGSLDPDVIRLNLNYCTSIADNDLNKSQDLRQVFYHQNTTYAGGKETIHSQSRVPTADDLAEADRLEAESKNLRVQAHNPLAALINSTQDSTDPTTKAINAVAWAEHWEWLGENKKSVGAAVAGIEAQATDLAALDYLIDLCPKVGVPELGLKYQDQKDSLSNPCPNAKLRAFRADLKNGDDAAAQSALDEAQAIDPSSVALQMARLDFAVHRNSADDIVAQARIIVAMEAGRMGGRSFDPTASINLSPDDIRIATLACLIAGNALEKMGDTTQAIAQYERGLAIASRALFTEIADPNSDKEPLLNSHPDLGPENRNVPLLDLVYDAHRRCACLLLMCDDATAALPHCVAMLRLSHSPETDAIAERIGYLIYQKLSWPSLPGPLPARWQSDFPELDKAPIGFSAASLLNPPSAKASPGNNASQPPNIHRAPDGSQYRIAQ